MMDYSYFQEIINDRRAEYHFKYEKQRSINEFMKNHFGEPKLFYVKNFVNGNEETFYYFYEKTISIVSFNEEYKNIKTINNKLKSKFLKMPRYLNQNHILEINYECGEKLIFESLEDSNVDWVEEYSAYIIELNKNL